MPARAHERAKTLDGGIEQSLAGLALPSVRDSFAQIRAYLQWQDADLGHRNNVDRILRKNESKQRTVITVGPSLDKGPMDSHFYLESGSRLSFTIVLREGHGRCALVLYRFHLSLPEGQSPSFYRFDLIKEAHKSPLTEPRCHYHPGVEDVRLPCPALTPLEVFDRIFMVIEPQLLGTTTR
jgi:hypothetical protein